MGTLRSQMQKQHCENTITDIVRVPSDLSVGLLTPETCERPQFDPLGC